MDYILSYFLVVNFVSIVAVAIDKTSARNGGERIKESALLGLSAIGGSLGVYAAMRIIRHKTRKNKFMVGIPVIIMCQIALAAIIYFNFFK